MRVVVAGGGIVGLATAYEAARRGDEVTVLESRAVGRSATHGNATLISMASGPVPAAGVVLQSLRWMLQKDSPLYVAPSLRPTYLAFLLRMAVRCNAEAYRRGAAAMLALAHQTPQLFDEYATDGLEFEMHDESGLSVFSDRDAFEAAWANHDVFTGGGLSVERVVGRRAVQEYEPVLAPKYAYALHCAADRRIEPDSLVRALVGKIRELGGRVHEHRAVTGFARAGGRVSHVLTRAGDVPADAVVLTAGVWTRDLGRMLGIRLPLEAGKGYHVEYSPPPTAVARGLILEDAHCAVAPLDGRVRVAGTMEFGTRNEEVDAVRVEALRRAAAASFTDWAPRDDGVSWAGMRPMTPDGLPMVGRLPSFENVYVGAGHAMLGLSQAPATARALVSLIKDGEPVPAARAFDPGRFALRRARLSTSRPAVSQGAA